MIDASTTTLRQGLDRYADVNQGVLSTREVSAEAERFFRCHDAAHVVFGCDTTIVGEGTVKIWTIFGTTLGFWKHVRAYSEAGAFSLFREYSWRHVVKSIGTLLASMPRTIVRATRMTKRWPWSENDRYLDETLADIRAEFGIEVEVR